MKTYKPLHLGFNQQVLEHNRRFHFIASVTMGIRLSTGESLLETEYQKDAIENMGSRPFPDVGMPKPYGEYLVSGCYHAPGQNEVTGGEIRIKIGYQEKNLFIFGPRTWEMGVPSRPMPITSMPVEYSLAYGGNGLESNPDGMGYKEEKLPCIEIPDQLIESPNSVTEPAGLSVIDPSWSQRRQYEGTYDDHYLKNYFPGYPADFDWQFFNVAPRDQWRDGYYQGDEVFEFHNMHPEKPEIRGKLPGYYARCFIHHAEDGATLQFDELLLNLDTLWFFPGADLVLLIWRGGMEVADDEADQIKAILLAFESLDDQKRSLDEYKQALGRRINSDDVLLNNFNTVDLIPVGVKCAMDIFQENAFKGGEQSGFSQNFNAKIEQTKSLIAEKTDELVKVSEQGIENTDVAKNNPEIDLAELTRIPEKPPANPDIDALNAKLEAILPGITSGDANKTDLKNFSFDKIDKILAVARELLNAKTTQASDEIEKARQQIKLELEKGVKDIADDDAGKRIELESALNAIDKMQPGESVQTPLPRVNAEEISARLSAFDAELAQAMQNLHAMKSAGVDNEQIRQMEKSIHGSLEERQKTLNEALRQAESAFKDTYILGAHYMEQGLSPHESSLEQVRDKFMQALSAGHSVAGKDWACIDLSGQVLDNVDLSNCLLEQVNFTGASLKGVNFSNAVLARSVLNDADLTGANLEGANVGNVKAHNTDFSGSIIKNARLSKAEFYRARFNRACIEDVETLDVSLDESDFTDAVIPQLRLINAKVSGADFTGANLSESVFLQCEFHNTSFQETTMTSCVWMDVLLDNVHFDEADISRNCFASSEPDKSRLSNISFTSACLDRCNFQNIVMPDTNLSGASMDNALFSGADLTSSNLTHANAPQAQFRKAILRNCDMSGINLMEGSLAKARLSGALLVRANLYAVDFLRAYTGATDFSGSNLDNTLLQDWQPS